MSIKLYQGRKLKVESMDAAYHWCQGVGERMHDIAEAGLIKQAVIDAINFLDYKDFKGESVGDTSPYSRARLEIEGRIRKIEKSKGRDPAVDYTAEIVILKGLNEYLLIPYIESPELMAVIDGQPEVEFFGYWDNVDPEEGVSDEEWAYRYRTWEHTRIFNAGFTPSRCGFTISPVDYFQSVGMLPWDIRGNYEAEKFLGEYLRSDNRYECSGLSYYWDIYPETEYKQDPEDFNMSEYIRVMREVKGLTHYKEFMNDLRSKAPRWSLEHLMNSHD